MSLLQSDIILELKKNFYFTSLTEDQLQSLASITRIQRFDNGELIFTEGQRASSIYQVIKGQIQIYKISKEGKEMILHLLGPGEVFAEYPFFANLSAYPANAFCLQPSEVLAIDGTSFRELAQKNPDIMFHILEQFAHRLHEFNQLIEDLSLRSVDSRLAKYLLSVSEYTPQMAIIPIHKKTLASILGTIPETLSRSIKKLINEGVISISDKEIQIHDRHALKLLADTE